MKTCCFLLAFVFEVTAGLAQQSPEPLQSYSNIPLSFEANQGQAPESVRYLSRQPGYTLALSTGSASFVSDKDSIKLELTGSNKAASAIGEDPQAARTNYFLGDDRTQWHTGIANYGRVRFDSVLPGIDLVYYGNHRQLEHDFIVAAHANPSRIAFTVSGAKPMVDPSTGDLNLKTAYGIVRLLRPIAYQQSGDTRIPVRSSYKLQHNRITFDVGRYDHTRPLIIDPIVQYSTYLGQTSTQSPATHIAIDSSGNAYIAGTAVSNNFPITPGAFQQPSSTDPVPVCFISKMNPSGSALVYSTFLGGSIYSGCTAIAVDASGSAYVTGITRSINFPVSTGAFQKTYNNSNSLTNFVTKLDPSGSALSYSTYLGGSGNVTSNQGDNNSSVGAKSVAVNSSGNAYVTGSTQSQDFPVTPGAYQGTYDGQPGEDVDGFVTELNPQGSAEVYSTFLSKSTPNGIALDAAGNAYVAGATADVVFPTTPGAFQTHLLQVGSHASSQNAGFLTKLNPTGATIVFSTFLQETQPDNFTSCAAVAVDADGNAFVTGSTGPLAFPTTPGVVQPVSSLLFPVNFPHLFTRAFLTKFNPSGTALVFSTYLGGNLDDVANGIALDNSGLATVVGTSSSSAFPVTPGAFETTDPQIILRLFSEVPGIGFVSKFNSDASTLLYSTFVGGSGGPPEAATGVAVDNAGNLYVSGETNSFDFPVTGTAYDMTPQQASSFVVKFATGTGTPVGTGSLTTLASPTQAQFFGENVAINAFVGGEGRISTGNVTFILNGKAVSSVPLNSAGVATLTTKDFLTGTDEVTNQVSAVYNGSSTFDPSSADYKIYLYPNSSMTVTGNPAVIATYQPVKVTALVKSTIDHTIPTGTVAFYLYDPIRGNLPLATVNLDSTGTATYATSLLGFPDTVILADYSGSPNFSPATAYFFADVTGEQLLIGTSKPTTTYGTPFASPIVANILDVSRMPVSGAVVKFSGSGLSFNPTSAVTDATGRAQTMATPTQAGRLTANASAQTAGYNLTTPLTLTAYPFYLTVSPASPQTLYGQSPAPLTYAITGFLNGDTLSSSVTGQPALSTSVVKGSAAGQYLITDQLGTLTSPKYTFALHTGTYRIHTAPLTLTATSFVIHVGDPLPTFTYTATGLVNGDTLSGAYSGAPQIYCSATTSAKAGKYTINGTIGTLHSQNYYFVGVPGTLTILP